MSAPGPSLNQGFGKGLLEVTATPYAMQGSFAIINALYRNATDSAVAAGAFSAEEMDVWWRELEAVDRRGDFFSISNMVLACGTVAPR